MHGPKDSEKDGVEDEWMPHFFLLAPLTVPSLVRAVSGARRKKCWEEGSEEGCKEERPWGVASEAPVPQRLRFARRNADEEKSRRGLTRVST